MIYKDPISINKNNLVISSHSRSGNLFLSRALKIYHDSVGTVTFLHDPKIIEDLKYNTITILRDPYEAFSSLLYSQAPNFGGHPAYSHVANFDGDVEKFIFWIKSFPNKRAPDSRHIEEYLAFLEKIEMFKEKKHFFFLPFDMLKEKPADSCKAILKYFDPKFEDIFWENNEFEKKVKQQLYLESNMDQYLGHMPREKDELRMFIDNYINDAKDLIDPIYKRYKSLVDSFDLKKYLI